MEVEQFPFVLLWRTRGGPDKLSRGAAGDQSAESTKKGGRESFDIPRRGATIEVVL